MSPARLTERLHFFIAPFTQSMRMNNGGGIKEEGEDIKVLEVSMKDALKMIDDGIIIDAKNHYLIQHLVIKGIVRLSSFSMVDWFFFVRFRARKPVRINRVN